MLDLYQPSENTSLFLFEIVLRSIHIYLRFKTFSWVAGICWLAHHSSCILQIDSSRTTQKAAKILLAAWASGKNITVFELHAALINGPGLNYEYMLRTTQYIIIFYSINELLSEKFLISSGKGTDSFLPCIKDLLSSPKYNVIGPGTYLSSQNKNCLWEGSEKRLSLNVNMALHL